MLGNLVAKAGIPKSKGDPIKRSRNRTFAIRSPSAQQTIIVNGFIPKLIDFAAKI